MDDNTCDEERALETMRKSAIYGMRMFPDLGDKDNVRTAIIEARARKRRKEIAREGIEEHTDLEVGAWEIDEIGPPPSSLTATTSSGSSPLSAKRRK